MKHSLQSVVALCAGLLAQKVLKHQAICSLDVDVSRLSDCSSCSHVFKSNRRTPLLQEQTACALCKQASSLWPPGSGKPFSNFGHSEMGTIAVLAAHQSQSRQANISTFHFSILTMLQWWPVCMAVTPDVSLASQ